MLPVLTVKVLLTVNVMLGIMELDLIVLVSKFFIRENILCHVMSVPAVLTTKVLMTDSVILVFWKWT
jgi:hypothetical protein